MLKLNSLFLVLSAMLCVSVHGQEASPLITADNLSGLRWRNIGPAFTSGRIADIAIHPEDDNLWYVAVGSGGVWKTENAGVTWIPIFDNQSVYSTGCVSIDPINPHTVWVGTGENVGGRHVGFGDGVYKSMDGGKNWENMGLGASEHISEIVIHPENSEVIFVAVQGPLWNPGGDRGLYKSIDGGESWKKVLGNEEWTGVTDIAIDPRDPDWMYAATWDRHRTVAAYMGGGPGSGIHRSRDGGETWEKLTQGIPGSNLGKIGLAISPQEPDIVYAAIELDRKTGGLFKSTDRGSSWQKMSEAVSGATGPHYYQELYASPHQFDRLYLMDVRIQVSDDGGKTFRRLKETDKHSDNHAIAFRKDDPDYLLVGTDGGMFESFDLAETWRFFDNLPITQYYKLAVDDSEPFYNIYGGTQDNGSHGGPSRTDNRHGIRNGDWWITLGADGHQSAIEPGNPAITYAETQQGGLHRIDQLTGEQVFIQPQPGESETYERFNWDAPILVSPHDPKRIYVASHRVWKSDDRGDSWTAISGDLTRDQERLALPIMGRQQSWDNPWDVGAMSNFNTITSLAESPLVEGLVYVGTDDGIVQITEDGGENWRKVEVGNMPGVPDEAFVNDIRADLFDPNTVYLCMDNHKSGDYKPYLMKSTDRGNSWRSITGDLPDKHLVWRIVQDHKREALLFLATEFGIFFTLNGGENWVKLKGGVPTISFRDLTIQRRENDLVAASFGRGFFVLDDISVLREISEDQLKNEGSLFSVRKAWWYQPRQRQNPMGANQYIAPNPDFGATFTYFLSDSYPTLKGERSKHEKALNKEGKDVPFPGWEALLAEKQEDKVEIWLTVKDQSGNIVRKLKGPASKGMHRVAWDLRYASSWPISPEADANTGNNGWMAPPGTYNVLLSKYKEGIETILSGPLSFEVVPLRRGALKAIAKEDVAAYQSALNRLILDVRASEYLLNKGQMQLNAIRTALERTPKGEAELLESAQTLNQELMGWEEQLNGNAAKREIGEKQNPTIGSRMSVAYRGLSTTYGPTPNHRNSLQIAQKEVGGMLSRLKEISGQEIPALYKKLKEAGAPWIEGMPLPE